MRIEIIFLAILLLIAFYFSGIYIREGAETNESPTPSPYRTTYQNALESVVILQDTTIKPDAQIALLGTRLSGKAYSDILSNTSMSTSDKIKEIKSIFNTTIFQGQLTARVISLDQKLDEQTKINMIKNLGKPPPVFPNIFNKQNSNSNNLALIQTKTF